MASVFHLLFTWSLIFTCLMQKSDCILRRYTDCVEERLKIRESVASVIITGTVKRQYDSYNSSQESAEVQVKRVIKGDNIKTGEYLLVEGFGNPNICTNKVKVKDSKIFLLRQLETGTFRLNSSVLQINIPNLSKISAAVKDEIYRKRPPIQNELCERKYCPFNGDCYEENLRSLCRCATTCKTTYSPICANDGLTYNSECLMRLNSCQKRKRLYVQSEGICSRSI